MEKKMQILSNVTQCGGCGQKKKIFCRVAISSTIPRIFRYTVDAAHPLHLQLSDVAEGHGAVNIFVNAHLVVFSSRDCLDSNEVVHAGDDLRLVGDELNVRRAAELKRGGNVVGHPSEDLSHLAVDRHTRADSAAERGHTCCGFDMCIFGNLE